MTSWKTLLLSSIISLSAHAGLKSLNEMSSPFELGSLPYAANSLEPYVDRETMLLHHDKHHQSYVDKLNENFKEEGVNLLDIFTQASQKTDAVRNNAGGHWNHTFFWSILSGDESQQTIPSRLKKEIEDKFGSMKSFKEQFEEAGKGQFGSGWVWLIRNKYGELQITSTSNQDNPLMDDAIHRGWPILGADVWEHAYYLKYYNERGKYLKNFWNVVNWKEVNRLNEEAKELKVLE